MGTIEDIIGRGNANKLKREKLKGKNHDVALGYVKW